MNNREKNLLKILLILILLIVSKLFIVDSINLKVINLQNEKQNIINSNNMEKNLINNEKNIEEDIILKIEKELKQLVKVDYIDKKMIYDENNNDAINIEIKVSGNLEQIFKIQQTISNLELDKDICYFEINRIQNNDNVNEGSEELVECIMEINVG